jgi:hypothetical protein
MKHFFRKIAIHLRISTRLISALMLCLCTSIIQAKDGVTEQSYAFWEDLQTAHKIQVGIDTWSLRKNLGEPGLFDNTSVLYLADSQPEGNYTNPATWIKIDAEARTENKVMRFRYDNNQSVGSRIDELSMDLGFHAVGVRAGILGYKVSWCRTHDVDSPWIRENDPFCVVRTTSTPIKSAPGVQIYVNTLLEGFKVQSLIGVYSPLLFNYDTREFTNYALTDNHVFKNNKYGATINAINLENGLELRLSYLRSDQASNYNSVASPTQRIEQNTDVAFAAVSANISPVVNLRLSYFSSREHANLKYPPGFVSPGDTFQDNFYSFKRKRTSKVLEMNYQHSPRDVLSIAYSKYDANDRRQFTEQLNLLPDDSYTINTRYNFTNTSTSASWRHDWQRGIFTIIQITRADLTQDINAATSSATSERTHSTGKALGFRLGYVF